VSALAVNDSLSFNQLKALLKTTDGNLSVHARRLEEAQYITCTKSFEGRIPKTEYRLTAAGRRALERYLDHMEALISRHPTGVRHFFLGTDFMLQSSSLHIAIVMDGNGRWARRRGLPRVAGQPRRRRGRAPHGRGRARLGCRRAHTVCLLRRQLEAPAR